MVENILKALEGVKSWRGVANWLVTFYGSSLKDAVELFLWGQGHFQPSWRAVIFALDGAEETPLASHIRSYGEPVQGRYTYIYIKQYLHTGHAMACVPPQ